VNLAMAGIIHQSNAQTPRSPDWERQKCSRQRGRKGGEIYVEKGIQGICNPRWAANFR
jgi:hypothetical protein